MARHTPEQCSFGLIDACRHGRTHFWLEYFYTPHHLRELPGSPPPARVPPPKILVSPLRTPPDSFVLTRRWGRTLSAVSREVARAAAGVHGVQTRDGVSGAAAELPVEGATVDVCLVFPKDQRRCPGVMYRANGTHWTFDTLSRDFTGRPL